MKTYRGKYEPLFQHLARLDDERWPATFEDIETILAFPLPKSARRHSAWWANEESGSHSHARAWHSAGWRTSTVDLYAETLVFERLGRGPSIAAKGNHRGRRRTREAHRVAFGIKEAALDANNAGALTLGGQTFQHVTHISPEAGPDSKPMEYMPQQDYYAAASTPLNRHGSGPFCRFAVAGLPAAPGVYAVTVAQKLVYVGIATDLKRRWGSSGYAQIQPKNCFRGGQSTNCKMNHAILLAARDGLAIRLWIHRTENPRPIEKRLIAELSPPWNDQR